MKFKPVLVKWVDITTRQGWFTQEEADEYVMHNEEKIVMQSGFLYEEDDDQVVLISSYFLTKDMLGDFTKIPKGAIVEMIELSELRL